MKGIIGSSHSKRKALSRFFQYLVLTLASILIFVPIVILIFGSLKTTGQMYSEPYTVPNPPNWENIISIVTSPTFWILMKNSIFVMILTTAGTVIVSAMVAFVLARMKFKGKDFVFQPVYPWDDVPHQCGHPAGLSRSA